MKIFEKLRWALFWLAMVPVCLVMSLVEDEYKHFPDGDVHKN